MSLCKTDILKEEKRLRLFGSSSISIFYFPVKVMLSYFLLPSKFDFQWEFFINVISIFS